MQRLSQFLHHLLRHRAGNVMYLTAGLLLPILATMGAGIDLGQAYMAKSRLQQACDAGVLAGRRAMGDGQYGDAARTAANNMFNFNYQPGQYGSTGIAFSSSQRSNNEVSATATATVPTIIMRTFGFDSVPISVNCTAKLEISNADIMFVLDTTGSMNDTNPGDTQNKISALRTEVMAFFDTVAAAQSSTSIVRYGVVPYSSDVNVGFLLRDANRSWISDTTELPSRTANFQLVQPPDNTSYGSPYQENVSVGSYTNTSTYYTGYSQNSCNNLANPNPSNPSATSSPSTTTTGSTTDQYGNTVTTYETRQDFKQTVYRYQFQSSNNRCYKQSAPKTYRQVTPYTVTQYPPVNQFVNYTYQATSYNVRDMVNGTPLVVNNGPNGTNVTASWNGCIMERDTVDFASGQFPPADALDLNIDLVPTSDDRTKWKVYMPNIAYPSASQAYLYQTPSPVTTNSDWDSYDEGNNKAGGWSACPAQAMRLRALTAADRSVLQNYVNTLVAVGGTYHDVGMVWGTRFISPTGIFAADNATAPNGNPISRHIIFMTDGYMSPNPGIYGFQGQEYEMGRVGSTNIADLTARHNTRFQAACNEAKARNITVWVVSFGTTLSPDMQQCASGDKAFAAANAAALHQQFQAIAAQITRLRLSQ